LIHQYVKQKFGKDTILGFFDVDEFIVAQTRNLKEEIVQYASNFLCLSVCSFEVNSDLFDVSSEVPLIKQTTRSTSVENRNRSGVLSFKTLLNLSLDENDEIFGLPPDHWNLGSLIHLGGVDQTKFNMKENEPVVHPSADGVEWKTIRKNGWCLAAPQRLLYLHYRSPSRLHTTNNDLSLYDKDYEVP
jgi:hypothetical protein